MPEQNTADSQATQFRDYVRKGEHPNYPPTARAIKTGDDYEILDARGRIASRMNGPMFESIYTPAS